MVEVKREAYADVQWWCDVIDGRDFGPVFATLHANDEYSFVPTEDLKDWAKRVIDLMLEEVCNESCNVFGDSVWCGHHKVLGDPYDILQTPPIMFPAVRANIEVILGYIKDNLDDKEYVMKLKRQLDDLLRENNLTREDIRFLIAQEGLESELL